MSDTEDIQFEIRGPVAVATLCRPDVLNAFRQQTIDELFALLARAEADPAVRAFILTGTGRAFSAGQDLREVAQRIQADTDLVHSVRDLQRLQELTRTFLRFSKPTVAAINGIAVGLGAEIALACDVRIAAATATMGFVEVRRSLFPTNGVLFLLPRIVGHGHAMQLLLTGEQITAQRAEQSGLVGCVAPADTLMDEAVALARQLADNAPMAVRLVKQAMRRTHDSDLEQMLHLEVDGMLACLRSDDLREGTAAFLNRRVPTYTGE